MKKRPLLFFLSLILGLTFAGPVSAQNAQQQITKEQCLACHGLTFSELVNKNIRVESDTGPVNPHVFLPHNDPNGEVTECTNCHQVHTTPPPKGYKDDQASLETCYSCHHNYELKKCSSCHDK